MAQIQPAYQQTRIPLANMSYTPDVASAALGANEYNYGANIETDVRGLRSVSGDEEIFSLPVPGVPTYVSGGFRQDEQFWTILATDLGRWYATLGGFYYDITPVEGVGVYTQAQNITEGWNGTVAFFNDEQNPPMFWSEFNGKRFATTSATWIDGGLPQPPRPPFVPPTSDFGVVTITFIDQGSPQFTIGQEIILDLGDPFNYNGQWTVVASSSNSVSFHYWNFDFQGFSPGIVGDPLPKLTMYSNQVPLGILNISYIDVVTQRVTFQFPQAIVPFVTGGEIVISSVNEYFNGTYTVVNGTTAYADVTMTPTAVYPGNQVGDIAPLYSWNFNPSWKRVYAKFMRLYNTPNVGTILVAGNLVATDLNDNIEYYPVTVSWSQNFGLNTAPITWQPTLSNVANQLEVPLRGEAVDAFITNGQMYLSSYWDTVVFSPINFATTSSPVLGVRLLTTGRGVLTSNCTVVADSMIYGIDARDIWVFNGQSFQGIGTQRVRNWFFRELDPLYVDRVFMINNSSKNQIEIYYPTRDATDGVPDKMLSYRYDLNCWNAPRDVDSATFACESPRRSLNTNTGNWNYNPASRVVIYARGLPDEFIVQKDQTTQFTPTTINPTGVINSYFRRDNIRLTKDYSTKTMVHRILPEFTNLTPAGLPISVTTEPALIGNLTINVEGQQSVGSASDNVVAKTISSLTDEPWVQINQNAYRVCNLALSNASTTTIWYVNAVSWQTTDVEDDR